MGLNDFQTLVHQRRGVNGDTPAHSPYWMLQSLFRADRIELAAGSLQEGSAGSRQYDAFDLFGLPRAQALVNGAVLAVNGEDLNSLLGGGAHHQLTCRHQGFLIRQAYVLA